MKLQKIKSLCSKSAAIRIYESADCQWLSDGTGIYPVYNLPKMTDEQIFTLFDVPEDKKGKVRITRAPLPTNAFNFDDADLTESLLERVPISVRYLAKDLLPFSDFDGRVTYIGAEHLAPFADLKEGYGLYLRTNAHGYRYVVVKKGLLLIGVILPSEIIKQEAFINSIRSLCSSVAAEPAHIAKTLLDQAAGSDQEKDVETGTDVNQLNLDSFCEMLEQEEQANE